MIEENLYNHLFSNMKLPEVFYELQAMTMSKEHGKVLALITEASKPTRLNETVGMLGISQAEIQKQSGFHRPKVDNIIEYFTGASFIKGRKIGPGIYFTLTETGKAFLVHLKNSAEREKK